MTTLAKLNGNNINSWKVIPFDKVSHLDEGIVYKAALTENADTIAGWGLSHDGSSWKNITGMVYEFVNGGLKVTNADYLRILLPTVTAEEIALQRKLSQRVTIQAEFLLSELTLETSISINDIINSLNTTSAWNEGLQFGTYFIAEGAQSGYRVYTADATGNELYNSPVGMSFGTSAAIDGTAPNCMLHNDITTDSDGYITISLYLDGRFAGCSINGIEVATWLHDNTGVEDSTRASDLIAEFVLLRETTNLTVRNLVISDRPRPFTAYTGAYHHDMRISLIGHSFGDGKTSGLTTMDIGGKITGSGQSSPDSGMSKWQEHSNTPFTIINCSKSSRQFQQATNILTDAGTDFHARSETTDVYGNAAGNYLNPVGRHRPHFCVIWCLANSAAMIEGDVQSNMLAQVEYLQNIGCIPVYLTEQNMNNPAAPAPQEFSDQLGYMRAYVETLRAIYGDNGIGLADANLLLGGDTGLDKWAFNDGSNYQHPNFKASAIYGAILAEEINRIIADPPTWSRLYKDSK